MGCGNNLYYSLTVVSSLLQQSTSDNVTSHGGQSSQGDSASTMSEDLSSISEPYFPPSGTDVLLTRPTITADKPTQVSCSGLLTYCHLERCVVWDRG